MPTATVDALSDAVRSFLWRAPGCHLIDGEWVEPADLLGAAQLERNGGFPLPPSGMRTRVVAVRHAACGASTSVSLPLVLPPGVVRRVVCGGCGEPFDPRGGAGALRAQAWRWLSVPLAAAAVVGGLLLVQGNDRAESGSSAPAADADAAQARPGAIAHAEGAGEARLVRRSTFTLALPAGWKRAHAAAGATFAAAAPGGAAEATLWIDRVPRLDFSELEARSLEQLRRLAASAHVVDRSVGPTAEGAVVRLAADNPPGSPDYEVTLRASGPYRYYLATTLQSQAPAAVARGVDLIHGSLVPRQGER